MDNIEYINAYVEVLNKKLHELVSQSAMQETHLSLARQNIQVLQEQLQLLAIEKEKLAAELEKLKKKKGVTQDDF